MVNSLPNLLCLDDEHIANKERGVAKDVVQLCNDSNTGEHLYKTILSDFSQKHHALLIIIMACRFDEFSYVGNEACFH